MGTKRFIVCNGHESHKLTSLFESRILVERSDIPKVVLLRLCQTKLLRDPHSHSELQKCNITRAIYENLDTVNVLPRQNVSEHFCWVASFNCRMLGGNRTLNTHKFHVFFRFVKTRRFPSRLLLGTMSCWSGREMCQCTLVHLENFYKLARSWELWLLQSGDSEKQLPKCQKDN